MYNPILNPPCRQLALTTEEGLQAEELDLALALNEVGRGGVGRARPRPVHLALAEAHSVDVVAADLQDEAAVHDVEQATGEEPLLLVGDVFTGGEAQLLQAHGPEQLLLVHHGAQVTVEEAAAQRVAHSEGWAHLFAPVAETHLQVSHWEERD